MKCPKCGLEMLSDPQTNTSVCLVCPGVLTDESLAEGPAPVVLTDFERIDTSMRSGLFEDTDAEWRRLEMLVAAHEKGQHSAPDAECPLCDD